MSEIKPSNKKKPVTKKETTHGFSIVIANFNYETYVIQAIESALNQSYSHDHFEVIIVDDGSTDNSRQLIADIAAKNNNLRVITQTNLGQAAAFYAGVNMARHEWICLLDSDDYFKPEKLSVLNSFINKQQADFDFICHNVDAVNEVNKASQDWFSRQNISADYLSLDDAQGGYPFANPCGQVFKKSILQKIAPWLNLSEWTRGADNALAWGSMFLSGRVCYLHQSLAVYRIHENNFFMASTPTGLLAKIDWLERWPKLLDFLINLHQSASGYYPTSDDREALIDRVKQYIKSCEKKATTKTNVPFVSFVTTCKNRLEHLKVSLPQMLRQSNSEVIVVDYGCLQGTSEWVRSNFPQVKLVRVDDDEGWNPSRARNLGAEQAESDWLFFIDADAVLNRDLVSWFIQRKSYGSLYLAVPREANLCGTCIIERDIFKRLGGYDEAFRGWGGEDTDLYDRVFYQKLKIEGYPSKLIDTIEHSDEMRAFGNQHDQLSSMNTALRVELLYRTVKRDIQRFASEDLELPARVKIMKHIKESVKRYEETKLKEHASIKFLVNDDLTNYQKANFNRIFIYSLCTTEHRKK